MRGASRSACILHADLDAFYASVEQRDAPRLRGRPVIVGAGVVLAASYEARAYGIRTAVGVARTKFLAKVASGVAKPDGLLVVTPADELDFLHPLAIERLWGVGAATADKLHDRGITTVGEVAGLSEAALVAMLGRGSGHHLHALAHNDDPRPVRGGRRRGSIGSQRALGRTPQSPDAVDATLVALVDRVARRMRGSGRVGRTVVLRLRLADRSRVSRSHTLPQATGQTSTLLAAARSLLGEAMPMIERRGLTLVGVAIANLDEDAAIQLALPFGGHDAAALDAAVDGVRERFGSAAVTRTVLLGREQGWSPPLLAD